MLGLSFQACSKSSPTSIATSLQEAITGPMPTVTSTGTDTGTVTQTETATPTPTASPTPTATPTVTETGTQTSTDTSTATPTETSTSTTTTSTTQTETSCEQQAPAWTIGAWTAECGPGVPQKSRSVSCDSACPCVGAQPATVESCVPDLYNNVHYEAECTAASGTIIWIDGKRVCSFTATACASGWTALNNGSIPYTITVQATSPTKDKITNQYVSTTFHNAFEPATAVESANYCTQKQQGNCIQYGTVYATVSQVACY